MGKRATVLGALIVALVVPLGPVDSSVAQDDAQLPFTIFEDPANDAAIGPAGAGQSMPADSFVDVRALRIVEDSPRALGLAVEVDDLQPVPDLWVAQGTFVYDVGFRVDGYAVEYVARVEFSKVHTEGDALASALAQPRAQLCIQAAASSNCFVTLIEGWADAETNEIQIRIPKSQLTGEGTPLPFWTTPDVLDATATLENPPEGTPSVIRQGDQLRDFWTANFADPRGLGVVAYWSDRAPDEGNAGDYLVKTTMANALTFFRDSPLGSAAVESGSTSILPLALENPTDRERRMKVTVEWSDPLNQALTGEPSSYYRATVPPEITVPAHGVSYLPLQVSMHERAQDWIYVYITATDADEPDVSAYARVAIESARSPALGNPRLYLHSSTEEVDVEGQDACAYVPGFICKTRWFNGDPGDPNAEPNAYAEARLVSNAYVASFLNFDGTTVPWVLAEGDILNATLIVSSPVPLPQATVTVQLASLFDDTFYAEGSMAASIGDVPTPVSVPVELLSAEPTTYDFGFPTAQVLDVIIEVGPRVPLGLLLTETSLGPRIHSDGSSVELPLRAPPITPVSADLSQGVHVDVNFALENASVDGARIQPLGARNLVLSVSNAGEPTEVEWVAQAPPGWTVQFVPGDRFWIEANQTVTAYARVVAPPDALRGAASVAAPLSLVDARSGSTLAAYVLRFSPSQDAPDERPLVADPGAQLALVGGAVADTPGLQMLWSILAAALVGFSWRRKRS